jgi:hypothetical protein
MKLGTGHFHFTSGVEIGQQSRTRHMKNVSNKREVKVKSCPCAWFIKDHALKMYVAMEI